MDKADLALYRDVFIQRDDAYARQHGTRASRDRHVQYICVRHPVTDAVLADHLTGRLTAAWYALDADGRCRWGAYDCDEDNPEGLLQLQRLARALNAWGMVTLLESSRRGGHLWVLVAPPGCPAGDLRRLLYYVLEDTSGAPGGSLPRIEVYPKQDTLPPGGFGSGLRGPLGAHQGAGGRRFPFLDPETLQPVGQTLRAQLAHLSRVAALRPLPATISAAVAALPPRMRIHRADAGETAMGGEGSGRDQREPGSAAAVPLPALPLDPDMAAAITVPQLALLVRQCVDLHAYVARYTAVTARGRAHCPLHPPDVHPSFAIRGSGPDAFWVCFHETNPATGRYLGGDVIELHARLRGLRYTAAAWELAALAGILPLNVSPPLSHRFPQKSRLPVRLWRGRPTA
jgi:hypothetical protein